jgi:transglycosylase-like protein
VTVTADEDTQAAASSPRHSAPRLQSAPVQATSSFQECVITRESGGNAQIWNASGHYGLYQFSYSTWVAAGGAPGAFGHASAGYQTEVFWMAYRLWGTSPWAPYDGC